MVQIVPGGEDCSSVQTLGGVCTVLEAQKPAAFILENVDMESKGKKADDSQPLDSKGWLYIFSGIFWTYVGTSGNMGGIIVSNSTANPFTHLLKRLQNWDMAPTPKTQQFLTSFLVIK